jgi:glycosyltransferase involved in cell wall biosynthesis
MHKGSSWKTAMHKEESIIAREKMKIAILSTYPPARCGIGTYSSYLYSGLRRIKGTMVYILTEKCNPKLSRKDICAIPCYDKERNYVADFIAEIKKIKPDIVHIQHEFGLFGWDKRLIRLMEGIKKAGFPVAITLHTVYSKAYTNRIPKGFKDIEHYYAAIGKAADKVMVHQHECKVVLERMGIPTKKMEVISHGTLVKRPKQSKKQLRKKLGLKEKAKIIMYFGFFKDVKMTPDFVKSLRYVMKDVPNTYFYVIGSFRTTSKRDKEHMKLVKKLFRKTKIKKNVIMINKFVDEDEVHLYMAAADIVAYPYDIGYWGDTGSAHRAIGSGATLVVSRIPKFDEIRHEIHEEAVVLPHRIRDWSKVMTRILTDKEFKAYIDKKTRQYAERSSWKNIAKQHYAIYKEIKK